MSLQHVIVLFDTLSLISMQFAATLFFILRRKSTTVQSSWRNCMFQDLQTYNGDTPKGKCTSSLHDMAKMETVSQPTCALETLFRSVHFFYCNQGIWYIWMCMHCSLLFIRHVVECIRQNHPLPMSQSIKMPCMRQPLYARTTYYQTKKAPAHAGFDRAHCTVPTSIVPCLLLDFANKFVVWMNSELWLKSTSIWVRRVAESWLGYLILASQ